MAYIPAFLYKHEMKKILRISISGNMLMVGFIKPHHPFDPPQKWIDMYDPDELELLPGWIEKSIDYDLEGLQCIHHLLTVPER